MPLLTTAKGQLPTLQQRGYLVRLVPEAHIRREQVRRRLSQEEALRPDAQGE
jgi:hypothetical protein